jgi:hypothetical protein
VRTTFAVPQAKGYHEQGHERYGQKPEAINHSLFLDSNTRKDSTRRGVISALYTLCGEMRRAFRLYRKPLKERRFDLSSDDGR